MLTSLRLINWRSHEDSTFEFKPGTNLFIGMMGSGKSSVLDAISFALFGTFPLLERRKLKLEDIIRLNENEAAIILEFAWDGTNYKVERKIEKKNNGTSTSADLYKDNSLIEKGTRPVTTYIESLFQIDYPLFTRAIYSEQNNIDYFLTLDPRRRKAEVDSLLGLDNFENARANCLSAANKIKSSKSTLESEWDETQYMSLLRDQEKKEKELADVYVSLDQATSTLIKTKDEESKLNKEFLTMKKTKEEYDQLSKIKIGLLSILASLEEEIKQKVFSKEEFEELKRLKNERMKRQQELEQQLKVLSSTELKTTKDFGVIETKIKSAREASEQISSLSVISKNQYEELLASQKTYEQELMGLRSQKHSLTKQTEETKDSLDKLEPGISKCYICESQLDDEKISHLKSHKNQLISSLSLSITEIEKQISTKQIELSEITKKIKEAEASEQKITYLQEKAKDLEKHLSEKQQLESSLGKLVDEKKRTENGLLILQKESLPLEMKLNEAAQFFHKKDLYEKGKKRCVEAEQKLSSIKFNEQDFESTRNSLETVRVSIEKLSSSVSSIKLQLVSLTEFLELLKKDTLKLENTKKEISKLAEIEESLTLYKNLLLETQTSLRSTLVEAINSAMNEVWNLVYPYKDYSLIRLQANEKDYSFEVFNGAWKPLESVASGGERACAALSLRIALAMVLTPNLSWLVLDEPTHNLDKEAVNTLSHALQYKVPEIVVQTFVITHEEGLVGSEFASSYKLTRNKGNFGSTVVEVI